MENEEELLIDVPEEYRELRRIHDLWRESVEQLNELTEPLLIEIHKRTELLQEDLKYQGHWSVIVDWMKADIASLDECASLIKRAFDSSIHKTDDRES